MNIMKRLNDRFLKIADFVSFGMGTPTNIIFWVLAVVIWFILGATRSSLFLHGSFLPDWFTSTAWNFPLNTITTLAELYIGFLVAAATNRAERELRKVIEEIRGTVEEVKKINSNQDKILAMLVDYQKKELAEDKKIIKDVEGIKK
jgi:low affinity Fe/Cu permease